MRKNFINVCQKIQTTGWNEYDAEVISRLGRLLIVKNVEYAKDKFLKIIVVGKNIKIKELPF